MKLSFVIPAFNKAPFLAETIESLLNQGERDIEIIVIDDGSTDSTPMLMEYYSKYSNIVYHRFATNMGRSEARNTGNRLAKADIICVCDADDLSAPDRADKIIKYFKDNPGKDVLYSGFCLADFYGNVEEKVDAKPFDIEMVKKTKLTGICHSTMAYRKKVVMEIPYTDGEFSRLGLDDWRLQLDLFYSGHKFGYIPDYLVYYRYMSGNTEESRNAEDVRKVKDEYLSKKV